MIAAHGSIEVRLCLGEKSQAFWACLRNARQRAFWAYETALAAGQALKNPADLIAAIIVALVCATITGATIYTLIHQFQWVKENNRLKAWLVANAEKIRSNQLAFYRSQRITLDTELVRHHVVFSALIVSCRMQTRWIIKGVEPRFWNAFASTVYTLFYGWWGIPFGLIWTPVAVVKNLAGSTTIRVSDLLQPAPPKPIGFKERFWSDYSRRLHAGFFVDEKPVGILPAQTTAKA